LQFLSLPTIPSTEAILRTRLQAHLVEIRADDIEIKAEGIENLTDDEMRAAARARGMPAPFGIGCTSLLRNQLQEWIELSLDRYPHALLFLWFSITSFQLLNELYCFPSFSIKSSRALQSYWKLIFRNIPSSLLLLSRAFKLTSMDVTKPSTTEAVKSLKDTINMLPEEAIKGLEMERFKSSAGLQSRLEYLRREEEGIKEENEEQNSKELSDAREALEV
jgi:hypothetical protein